MSEENMKLSLHHIGGRFGNGGFPMLPGFEQDMIRVYYDADRDCIDQIREKLKGSGSEIHVLPYCVGMEGRGTLHINYDTTSSSLLPINESYKDYYFFSYNHDFIASDSLKTMEEREIDISSLDGLKEIGDGSVPPPDFLSMDVQGAEYAVIEGARKVIAGNVVGVVIEAAMHPLYEGQRLFGDICKIMSESGFHFIKFLGFHDYAPYRAQVGQRGEGFHILADALFLRRIDSIEDSLVSESERIQKLRKLAFFSIVYNQFEYGLECLQRSGLLTGVNSIEDNKAAYIRFLQDISEGCRTMKSGYPLKFSEKYTYELSKKRFETADKAAGRAAEGISEKIWLRFIYPNIYRIAGIYRFLMKTLWASFANAFLPDSAVERTLKRYGLKDQAKLIKRRRVVEMWFCKKHIYSAYPK